MNDRAMNVAAINAGPSEAEAIVAYRFTASPADVIGSGDEYHFTASAPSASPAGSGAPYRFGPQ